MRVSRKLLFGENKTIFPREFRPVASRRIGHAKESRGCGQQVPKRGGGMTTKPQGCTVGRSGLAGAANKCHQLTRTPASGTLN